MKAAATPPRGRRFWLLLAVLCVAAVLVLNDSPTGPELVPAVMRGVGPPGVPGANMRSDNRPGESASPAMISALAPRIASARVDDVFAVRSWRKPVPPPVQVSAPSPPAAPQAPALQYTFLGKQLLDGRWQVFLGLQDRTLIVRENDTIDGAWRVVAIKPPSISLMHVPTGQQRSLAIGEGD